MRREESAPGLNSHGGHTVNSDWHSLKLLSFPLSTFTQWLLHNFQLTRSLCLRFLFFYCQWHLKEILSYTFRLVLKRCFRFWYASDFKCWRVQRSLNEKQNDVRIQDYKSPDSCALPAKYEAQNPSWQWRATQIHPPGAWLFAHDMGPRLIKKGFVLNCIVFLYVDLSYVYFKSGNKCLNSVLHKKNVGFCFLVFFFFRNQNCGFVFFNSRKIFSFPVFKNLFRVSQTWQELIWVAMDLRTLLMTISLRDSISPQPPAALD